MPLPVDEVELADTPVDVTEVDVAVVTLAVVAAAVLEAELVEPPVPGGRSGRMPPGESFVTRDASKGTHCAVVHALRYSSRVVGVPQKQPFWPVAQPVPVDPVCVV
jgi:hypothetical protein